jgi:AcrR family transcriptional regulator
MSTVASPHARRDRTPSPASVARCHGARTLVSSQLDAANVSARVVKDLGLRWVTPATQERSKDTQERVLAAARSLLARGTSWPDITIAAIVRTSRSSVGAFYARFRDKDTLLRLLQIELYREGLATATETFRIVMSARPSFDTMVDAFVRVAVRSYRDQEHLRRAIMLKIGSDGDFRKRSAELTQQTIAGLAALISPRFPAARSADVTAAVQVAHMLVYGVLDQELLFGVIPVTGVRLGDDEMVEELARAVKAYFRGRLKPTRTRTTF